MIRIGFIGRTKFLADTIERFRNEENYEITFIWTSKDEDYYSFGWEKFESLAQDLKCEFIFSPVADSEYILPETDLVLSMNFVNLIPYKFLEKFKYGILNAHPGDLPRYKGNACPNWAILNKEKTIGLVVHKMAPELDSGPIVSSSRLKINNNTYISDIYDWLKDEIPILFFSATEKVIGGFEPIPQTGQTLRTFPRKPEDSRLDFSKDVDWNHRLIRASSRPFQGAYCYLNDGVEKVFVFKAKVIDLNYEFLAVNGQILEKNPIDLTFKISVAGKVLQIIDYRLNDRPKDVSFELICRSSRNRLV